MHTSIRGCAHSPPICIMTTTKVRSLPRPWPLLRNGQDPSDLAARVAFHLHRLNLTGKSLINAKAGISRDIAADLAAARRSLTQHAVVELAGSLGIDHAELSRDLTIDEQREWFFYRVSARHSRKVWNNAHAAWNSAGWSCRHAAEVMGLDESYLRRQTHSLTTDPATLTFPPAARLTTALALPLGPAQLLPDVHRKDWFALSVTIEPRCGP